MGTLEIKNKKLRCIKCLDIRRILIIPGRPESKIEIMCHCNRSVESLLDYCKEFNKITDFKLVCANCGKEEIKHPRFCYECLEVYCSKCCNAHLPRKTGDENSSRRQSVAGHKTIHIEKMDYYCINHQTESFVGYCQQCLMNICPQCIIEKTHEFHKVDHYNIVKIDKKEKEKIKKNMKNAEKKMEKDSKTIRNFIKKNRNNLNVKDIEEEYKIISEENEDILELLKYCYDIYDQAKTKNYSITYNLINNSKFNSKILKLEKRMSAEEKLDEISKYLKKNAFILCQRSKTNTEEFEIDNDDNEDEKQNDETLTTMEDMIHRKLSDPKIESNNNYVITENNNNTDNNEVPYSAPLNFLQAEEEEPTFNELDQEQEEEKEKNPNIIINNNPQPPKNQIKKLRMPMIFNKPEEKKPIRNIPPPKKLKMPLMFEKREEEKKPEKPLPAKGNLKMPSIFDKKEEDNKPKERAAIIKTGANTGLGDKKDFLAQMLEKKGGGIPGMGMPGKPKNISSNPDNIQPPEEKIEIIHESNETGSTEQVLNKVTVTTNKKKKPRRAKFVVEGEENQVKPPQPSPAPVKATSENNQAPQDNNQVPQDNNQVPQDNNQVPQENNQAPQENNQAPQENNQAPQDNNQVPQDNNQVPQDNDLVPQENNQVPEEDKKLPTIEDQINETQEEKQKLTTVEDQIISENQEQQVNE